MKKQAIDAVYNELGKKTKIKFEYYDVEEKDYPMYEKALKLVLANKKNGMVFDDSYLDFEDKIVYLLHKVAVNSRELQKQDFSDEIIEAVRILERRPAEVFMDYVKRVARNENVIWIIRGEIYEALCITKRESLDEDDLKSLNENLAALHYLKSLGKE